MSEYVEKIIAKRRDALLKQLNKLPEFREWKELCRYGEGKTATPSEKAKTRNTANSPMKAFPYNERTVMAHAMAMECFPAVGKELSVEEVHDKIAKKHGIAFAGKHGQTIGTYIHLFNKRYPKEVQLELLYAGRNVVAIRRKK